MFLYAYRDKTKKGIPFPHHVIMYDNEDRWDHAFMVALKAERERLCRNALRAIGVEGKNWSFDASWDNEFGYSITFMFRDAGQAAVFRLMI